VPGSKVFRLEVICFVLTVGASALAAPPQDPRVRTEHVSQVGANLEHSYVKCLDLGFPLTMDINGKNVLTRTSGPIERIEDPPEDQAEKCSRVWRTVGYKVINIHAYLLPKGYLGQTYKVDGKDLTLKVSDVIQCRQPVDSYLMELLECPPSMDFSSGSRRGSHYDEGRSDN
jgi:hypothetical protein